MKFKAEYFFDGTPELIWEAREKRLENPDIFPELQKHKEVERREENGKIFSRRHIELASNIPGALKKVLSEDMMKCVDDSVYDLREGTHNWTIVPLAKNKIFRCTGKSKYTPFEKDGKVMTKRELEFEVKVEIPIFGGKVEELIIDSYKKNLLKDNDSLAKMIAIMKSKA